jgi:flotillin
VKAETEAEAFRLRTLAEANRDTVKFTTEAEANRQRMIAEASADAEKVKAAADATAKKHEADGDAYAQRTVAAAEAEAINVRAASLADGNQALIAANKLIDILPSLVAEASKGIAGSSLTILNGTDGVNQVAAGVVSQGLSIYEALRKSVATTSKESATDGPALTVSNGKDEKAGEPRQLH